MTPLRPLLCSEALEDRWLLAAPASVSPPSPLALPPAVVAALAARYPGAQILSSERSDEDGETEYDVRAALNGRTIEATLAPDGEVLEADATPTQVPNAPGQPPPPASPVDAVQVVSVFRVPEHDSDNLIDAVRLPPAVAGALAALYPGAEVTEAEFSTDGDAPEVGVRGSFNGKPIDVAFTPDGQVIETQEVVPPDALPQAVVEWLRRHYPGATVEDAAKVTAAGLANYEVQVTPPGGRPLEVTVHLPQARGAATADPAAVTAPRPAPIDEKAPRPPLATEVGGEPVAADAASTETPDIPIAKPRSETAVVRPDRSHEPGARDLPDRPVAAAPDATQAAFAVAAAPAAESLLQAAAILTDVLPVELAAVERGLKDVLGQIDALSQRLGGDESAGHGVALRVAGAATLLAAAEIFVPHSRRPRACPAPQSADAEYTWSWVLGTTTPRRHG